MEKLNQSQSPKDMVDVSFDDILYSILDNNDEPLWDKLIQQIVEGNVIPVIGADMLVDNSSNLHKSILEGLARNLGFAKMPASFSELIYAREYKDNYKPDNIYYQIDKLFAIKRFPVSERLRKLLSIKQFPFIITTSFTPIVEQAMREIWQDELNVLIFNNNPSENGDIKSEADLRKPTVYYMFGKVGAGAHKYVLTDIDLLDFVSSWLSNDSKARPKTLCNELKDKYLLMLGNTYSDWLFRFIWYSMRKSDLGRGMLAYDTLDESLINFLEMNDTFTKRNTSEVIDQLLVRLEKKLKENEITKFNKPEENVDVFISYSRSDKDVADKLYAALTSQGKRVWYDRYNLSDGGLFMDEIRMAISKAKYFIPIMTANIEKEKNDPHVYRTEWNIAIDIAISMGRVYMIPFVEKGFDFYKASIPSRLQQHNAIFFSNEDDIETAAGKIIHMMNQD